MLLTRHQTNGGARWALDGFLLLPRLNLSALLELPRELMLKVLSNAASDEPVADDLVSPIDPPQEVWAAGVTYLRSRDACRVESSVADVYE